MHAPLRTQHRIDPPCRAQEPTVTWCHGARGLHHYVLIVWVTALVGVMTVSSHLSGLHHSVSRVMNGRMHTTSTRKGATPMTTTTDPTSDLLEASERLEASNFKVAKKHGK